MAGKKSSAQDAKMAAMLKKQGVVRNATRCVMCGGVVALDRYKDHLMHCRGRQRA